MYAAPFIIAHLSVALMYAIFALALAARATRNRLTVLMAVAAAATAVWAGFLAAAMIAKTTMGIDLPAPPLRVADSVRDGAWFALMLAMLQPYREGLGLWRALIATAVLAVAVDSLFQLGIIGQFSFLGLSPSGVTTRVVCAVVGLVLVENLLRNLPSDGLWTGKFLAIGVLVTMVAELLLRIPNMLTASLDFDLLTVRALVYVLVFPLFIVTAIRGASFQLQFHSSRRIVLHLATLIVVGIVLQGTAVSAYYVRRFGGNSGTVLALTFCFAAFLGLAIALSSASLRSRVRVFINENFFSYKYDYRLEWTRFIRSMSSWEEEGLRLRALRTLADLLDSPGGALWLSSDGARLFQPAAHWGYQVELAALKPNDPALEALRPENCAYLSLAEGETTEAHDPATTDFTAQMLAAESWRSAHPTGWIVVPLRHASALVGAALLLKPRASRTLGWEDRNLIEIVALQLGAFLVQDETARALVDARQLEAFNKRFAFIIHDVKNTIGQLSLLTRNVEQFGHNAEFRKDMVATVREAVGRLQELLARLKIETEGKADGKSAQPAPVSRGTLDLGTVLSEFVQGQRRLGRNMVLQLPDHAVPAPIANREAVVTVLDHIVGNAFDVTPENGSVTLCLRDEGDKTVIMVDDSGPGMSAEFISNELFRPLRSTKGAGFGIGAFQAREVMRQLGGDIEVSSDLGVGTCFTLLLPRIDAIKEVEQA